MNPRNRVEGAGAASPGLASLRFSLVRYASKTCAPGGQARREPNRHTLSHLQRKNPCTDHTLRLKESVTYVPGYFVTHVPGRTVKRSRRWQRARASSRSFFTPLPRSSQSWGCTT